MAERCEDREHIWDTVQLDITGVYKQPTVRLKKECQNSLQTTEAYIGT